LNSVANKLISAADVVDFLWFQDKRQSVGSRGFG